MINLFIQLILKNKLKTLLTLSLPSFFPFSTVFFFFIFILLFHSFSFILLFHSLFSLHPSLSFFPLFLPPSLLFSSLLLFSSFLLLLSCFLPPSPLFSPPFSSSVSSPSSFDQENNQQLLQLCIIFNRCQIIEKTELFSLFLEPCERKTKLFFLFFQTHVSIRRKIEDPRTKNGQERRMAQMEEVARMAN